MISKAIQKGFSGCRLLSNFIKREYFSILCKLFKVPEWKDPDNQDFIIIESQLKQQGIALTEITIDKSDFETFKNQFIFGDDFYGGPNTRVYEEKILEHFISYKFAIQKMSSNKDVYVDVAAANSPWAKLLRDAGYNAYAIDLTPSQLFKKYDFYKTMNATATSFGDESVGSVSLQCAYEMFTHDDDIMLINELKRILKKGGRAIISPLYMYTHYSGYCSPEFWNKHEYQPKNAKIYVNSRSQGVPFSRKYDAKQFRERIVKTIIENNMNYNLYVLRNGKEIDPKIYCHFILEITKN